MWLKWSWLKTICCISYVAWFLNLHIMHISFPCCDSGTIWPYPIVVAMFPTKRNTLSNVQSSAWAQLASRSFIGVEDATWIMSAENDLRWKKASTSYKVMLKWSVSSNNSVIVRPETSNSESGNSPSLSGLINFM